MWTGAGLRVSLKTERGHIGAAYALQGSIKQGTVRRLQTGRQGFFVHREAVILTGDVYLFAVEVLYRMIRTVVTEFHLDGLGATGQSQQLMPQTNTERRNSLLGNFFDGFNRIITRLRITGAIG